MNITLKDGSVKVYDAPMTAADITKDISMGLYRAACCCRIDGQVRDLRTTVSDDCAFEVLTFDEEDGRRTFNHTASHIMAQAVKRLYPQVKLTIGPAPDTLLRVFMAWKPLDKFMEIPAQSLTAPERTGFTAVEWGGSRVR